MSSKSYYQQRIAEDQKKIGQINQDIQQMRYEIQTFNGYATIFSDNKDDVDAYDMTVGGTWKKDLCDTAQEKQKTISSGITDAINKCSTVVSDLHNCISTANGMISDLNADIQACQEAIEAIEEQEREEAARANQTTK